MQELIDLIQNTYKVTWNDAKQAFFKDRQEDNT